MSTYMIVSLQVQDEAGFAEYQKGVIRTFKIGEGRVLAASTAEKVEGDEPRNWNVIVEFPSVELARKWYDSEEYQKVVPLRTASAPGANIYLVEGLA